VLEVGVAMARSSVGDAASETCRHEVEQAVHRDGIGPRAVWLSPSIPRYVRRRN
jgi:hypothetical protein